MVGNPALVVEAQYLFSSAGQKMQMAADPHSELLKLGFEVSQSSVAKYMIERRRPPSQGWRVFLRNHAPDIAAMDLFVVPTISFDLLVRLHDCTAVLRRIGRRLPH